MNSNTHSARPAEPLTALAAVVEGLAAQDLHGLSDTVRAERVLVLVRLLDRLEGHWFNELAGVDARGAAGAEAGVQAGSTAGWLRARLRMGAAAASNAVRTARALFAGPLPRTAQALTAGELSVAHAAVLAHGTHDLPAQVTAEAEPALVEAARRLDPARLRRVLGHLRLVADPTPPTARPSGAMRGGACGSRPPWRRWWRWMGCWSPRPARSCWPPWNPWPAPTAPPTAAAVASGRPTPWLNWPAAPWRAAGCPRPVGSGPSCW